MSRAGTLGCGVYTDRKKKGRQENWRRGSPSTLNTLRNLLREGNIAGGIGNTARLE